MATNAEPVCERILLRLSGGAPQGLEDFGTDANILDRMVQEIKELVELGIQVGVVVGGGNLFRGAGLAKVGINRVVGSHTGMLATVMNGLAMRDVLHRAYVNAHLMPAVLLSDACGNHSRAEAISLLHNNRVVILSAGTGNPFFIADSTTCLRSIKIKTDVVLRAVKVDGIFTVDPVRNPTATIYEQLIYTEVPDKRPRVMDPVAFTLARDHKLPVRVFNMNESGALYRVVIGGKEGTLITE